MNKALSHVITCIIFIILLMAGFQPNSYSKQTVTEKIDRAEPEYHTFLYNGSTREYYLYIPDSIEPDAALVFVLHGYTGSAWWMMNDTDMNSVADDHDFVVCYPQGSPDYFGIPHWNARLTISQVDDIGFLSALAIYLQTEYDLSEQHTFSCGFSNGGFMSYTLACEASDVFKAIASVSGTMSNYTWTHRNNSDPVPILQIHGTNDTVVPNDGSMSSSGGWGGAPDMQTIIEHWATVNNCTVEENQFFPTSTNATFYRNGVQGNQVWYYNISDWGHTWPAPSDNTGTNASRLIWEFFHRYIMNYMVNQSMFDRGFPIRAAIDGDWGAAQSFHPMFNILTDAKIFLRRFGNPEFNLTVELRSDSPQGTILDSLEFTPDVIPSNWEWFTVDFSDITVSANETYFIVCPPAPEGVTTSFGYEWGYAFENQYDGGSFWFTRDGGILWRDLPSMYEFTFMVNGFY